jgi:hypothetical protein
MTGAVVKIGAVVGLCAAMTMAQQPEPTVWTESGNLMISSPGKIRVATGPGGAMRDLLTTLASLKSRVDRIEERTAKAELQRSMFVK